jgi:serpin B
MEAQDIVKGNNTFAFDLYARLRAREGNLFFSPYSISSALAMACAGARGETETQMISVLHLPKDREHATAEFAALNKSLNGTGEERPYQLNVANALWGALRGETGAGFLPDFIKAVQTGYDGEIKELDFGQAPDQSRLTINQWVEQKTAEKIKGLLPAGSILPSTLLVLTNAIYFKGTWVRSFDEKLTQPSDFMVTKDRKVTAPLMTQEANFGYMEQPGIQVLELPYNGEELSMIVILPRQLPGEVDGLPAFESSLTEEKLTGMISSLSSHKVIVYLPKFTIAPSFELAQTLSEMGTPLAFNSHADFSGMNGKRDLFFSAVFHKAFVNVDEKGTEAAAATAAVAVRSAMVHRPPIVFRADHPFLFLIRDKRSGSILFMGRMTNPLP